MIQALVRNRWLLVLCGVLEAVISAIYFIMQYTDGPLTFQAWNGAVEFLGELALAAGACSIAAGVWRSGRGKCWPLVLNGFALGALGLICYGLVRFSISFRTIALLIIVMALSIGVLELVTARTLRSPQHVAEEWFLGVAGVGSLGFALAFLSLVFRWIKLDPGSPAQTLLWLGAYFGFGAVCMLGLALRLHRHVLPQSVPKSL